MMKIEIETVKLPVCVAGSGKKVKDHFGFIPADTTKAICWNCNKDGYGFCPVCDKLSHDFVLGSRSHKMICYNCARNFSRAISHHFTKHEVLT